MRYLLRCEGTLAKFQEYMGAVPKGYGLKIYDSALSGKVTLERIAELEKETKHDLMSLVKALSEAVGEPANKYIHLGATSSDILDTSTAIQFKDANDIIEEALDHLASVLRDLTVRSREMICIGRTHGQYAIPTTFGFKSAVWVMEIRRHLERLKEMRKRVEVGKMSGAVGTGAGFGEDSCKLEDRLMKELGIGKEEISSQIVQRDRYAELIFFIANVATSLEKIATEIRNLQRNDINEVSESFDAGKQVGSSTMAQKRNPITCENICGLARIVRGLVIPAMENAVLWHERDLTNSSAERFIIPQAYILLDDMIHKTSRVIGKLELYPEKMMEKIERDGHRCMSESVIIAMVDKGISRQEAHERIRLITHDQKNENENLGLRELILNDSYLKELFTDEELKAILDPSNYLGHIQYKINKYILK